MDDETKELQKLARKYGSTAIETLHEIMRYGKKENARVNAARTILERGHGAPERKSVSDVNVNVFDARQAHFDALKKLVNEKQLTTRAAPVIDGEAVRVELPSTTTAAKSKYEE